MGSELVLPALRSVGSFFVRQNKYSLISLPALTEMTSGGVSLSNVFNLRHLDMYNDLFFFFFLLLSFVFRLFGHGIVWGHLFLAFLTLHRPTHTPCDAFHSALRRIG